jgi:endo-1,4-beta-mannosidase
MDNARWSIEQANQWYASKPWIVGCNFMPSNAINQLEMWQADTFDRETIDRELSWARDLGFNAVRVFLHDLAWQADPKGFVQRMGQYLEICSRHQISNMFVFFDDCWCADPAIGKQPEPKPFVHNSGWAQSPGYNIPAEPEKWGPLEDYVKDILTNFANDERVLLWDLYNEPSNTNHLENSLPLLKEVFNWARQVNPSQPLTAGIWRVDPQAKAFNDLQANASDIITFHNYQDAEHLSAQITDLRKYQRPVICSEYMIRTTGSIFSACLPVFKQEHVGCFNWGLVRGKTQTYIPWQWDPKDGEPNPWFADILWPDGTPYDQEEYKVIKANTCR